MPLHALLIGLNTYHPNSGVRPLAGCHSDVAAVKAFLLEHYREQIPDEQHLRVLLDEGATRQNVIDAFREHLSKAGPADAILIYYAGHGSQNIAAEAFHAFVTDRKEEGWVLYDSRLSGNFDLADKEIAQLLSEIGERCPHIALVSDSCHAGSLTRGDEEGWLPRFTPGTKEPRPLESYLMGAYAQQLSETGSLVVPFSKHVLLSACDKTELAWETPEKGGLFTHALLNTLRPNGGQLSYGDLYTRICANIRAVTRRQNPQATALAGFDPQAGFLGRELPAARKRRYPVYYQGNWRIEIGAGQGLCADMGERIPVDVYDAPTGGAIVGQGEVTDLGFSASPLHMATPPPQPVQTYWGELKTMPLRPFFVYCKEASIALAFESALAEKLEGAILLVPHFSEAHVEIRAASGQLALYDTLDGAFIHGVEGKDAAAVRYLTQVLERVAHWHRVANMQNRHTTLPQHKVPFGMYLKVGDEWSATESDEVQLPFEGARIYFRFIVGNHSGQALHMALIYLSPNYGIDTLFTDSLPIPSGKDNLCLVENYFHLPPDVSSETDIVQLIVSTESIDPLLFSQKGLIRHFAVPQLETGRLRSIGGLSKPDWFTKTFKVVTRE